LNQNANILILNPPSPPYFDICRDYAGGFGVAWHTKREDYGQSNKPCFHPFLPYASAVLLNEGYNYSVLDCQRLKLDKLDSLANIKKKNPDIIFSLIGLPSLKKDIELLNLVKNSLPNAVIVGVGTVCQFLENEILLNNKIDAISRTNYPYVSNMAELIKALSLRRDLKTVLGVSFVKDGNVIHTPESPDIDLGKLLPPCYDSLKLDGYENFTDKSGNAYNYIPILTGKGCPYTCIYCPYPLGCGKKWTHKSSSAIISEIEYLYARKIKSFCFRDQSFPMDKKFTIEVCKEIIHRKLDIAWVSEARVDVVSKNLIELMTKSGCKRIHYGVETGDPTLIKIGKPGINLETTKRAFRLTKESGLWTNAHVILGWPDETLETLARTYRFLLEINPDSINWNFLTPYPGTKLYEMAKENNLILTHDWSNYTSHTVVMRTKELNGDQLQKAANKIIRDYSKHRVMELLLHVGKQPRLAVKELKQTIKGYLIEAMSAHVSRDDAKPASSKDQSSNLIS